LKEDMASTSPQQQNPILIIAPLPRCGSTLLQRLINSSKRAVIYGENFYLMDGLPEGLADLHNKAAWKGRHTKAVMDRLLAGEDVDGTALFPDHPAFLAAARQGFYLIIRHYAQTSRQLGFARWGLKHQTRKPEGLAFLHKLLPGARYVFIFRDVLPVAKSMKARWPKEYTGANAMRSIGFAWHDRLKTILDHRPRDSLLLRYEDLIANPARGIDALEAFIGLEGINREVMKAKMNATDQTGDPSHVRPIYRQPSELTPEEEAALWIGSAELRRQLGYGAGPDGAKQDHPAAAGTPVG
jgi:hypothetical protein